MLWFLLKAPDKITRLGALRSEVFSGNPRSSPLSCPVWPAPFPLWPFTQRATESVLEQSIFHELLYISCDLGFSSVEAVMAFAEDIRPD